MRSDDAKSKNELIQELLSLRERLKLKGENEQLFQILTENTADIISCYDRKFRHLYINSAASALSGMEPNQFIGKIHRELGFPTYLCDYWEKMIGTAFKEKKRLREEFCHRYKGRELTFDFQLCPIIDSNGLVERVQSSLRDISRRKNIENEYAQISKEWQATFDATNDAIWLIDKDQRILRSNKMASKMFNIPCADIIGQHYWTIMHQTEEPIPEYPAIQAKQKRERQSLTLQIKDRWYAINADPILDTNNEYSGAVHIIADITDRKLVEIALKVNEKRLDLFFTQSLDSFFFMMLDEPVEWNENVDKDKTLAYVFSHQRVTKVNDAMLEQYGANRDQFVNLTPNDFFAHDLDHGKDTWRKLFDKGKLHVETNEKKLDGCDMIIEGDYVCLYDDENKIIGHFGIQRDITESKQAAEKLQRAYQLQTVLYQIAEATSVEKDLEALCRSIHNYLGSVLDVTNFYIALQKTEGGNLVFPYYVDEEDSSPGTVEFGNGLTEYVIKSGKSTFARMEDIYRMHNQGEIELLGTPSKLWLGVPLHLNGRSVGAIVVQSYKDENLYTESHLKVLEYVSSQIADALFHKQAEEQLAESDNLKGLLLDIITHDLRNPAASIFSFSEIAQKNSPGNKIIDLIHFSSEQLIKVLESTTVLTQAMFGEKIPKEELNLNDVLSGVASEFKLRLSEFKMSLDMNIQQSMVIYANPLISEIFKNYISNAIKYARDGEKILVEAVEEDESILVSVKDFGKTIPEKNRMHVFERNAQLAKENKRGRGLGLAIVKRIAIAHGGEAWVEPNKPKGNSFCLRIPR